MVSCKVSHRPERSPHCKLYSPEAEVCWGKQAVLRKKRKRTVWDVGGTQKTKPNTGKTKKVCLQPPLPNCPGPRRASLSVPKCETSKHHLPFPSTFSPETLGKIA